MMYLDSMGHLFSDESIEELFSFSILEIKLKPDWNHYSKNFPHFDLTTKKKKDEAIKKGAKYIVAGDPEWRTIISAMKISFKNDLPKYLSTGLYGQKIFRVDFKKCENLSNILNLKK